MYLPNMNCLYTASMEFLNRNYLIVYQKGDIVKQAMKKGSFVPKNVPGVGWGGSCRGGVQWVM